MNRQLELPLVQAPNMQRAFRLATHDLREFRSHRVSHDELVTAKVLPHWRYVASGADAVTYVHASQPVLAKLPVRSVLFPQETRRNRQDRQETAQFSIVPPVLLPRDRKVLRNVPDARLRFARLSVRDARGREDEIVSPLVLQELLPVKQRALSELLPNLTDAQADPLRTFRVAQDRMLWHPRMFPQIARLERLVSRYGMTLNDMHGENWERLYKRLMVFDTGRFLQHATAEDQTRAEVAAQRMLGTAYRALLRWTAGRRPTALDTVLPEARPVRVGKRGGRYVLTANNERRYVEART